MVGWKKELVRCCSVRIAVSGSGKAGDKLQKHSRVISIKYILRAEVGVFDMIAIFIFVDLSPFFQSPIVAIYFFGNEQELLIGG